MVNKSVLWLFMLILFSTVLAACSGGNTGSENKGATASEKPAAASQKPAEPVELMFMGSTDKERFMREHGNDLAQKFPNIKINYYFLSAKDDEEKGQLSIQGALTRGMAIDIMHVSPDNIQPYLMDTQLGYDISDLIKKHKYDLSVLYPQAVETIKLITGGPLFGLPSNRSVNKLYYNRDLFDKFGVSYPKDGLTYDEVYDLAKRMTRTDSGVQYQGIIVVFPTQMGMNQLSAPFVDPQTNKSTVATDPRWSKMFANLVRFHQIPGNEKIDGNAFTTNGTAAMFLTAYDLNQTWKVNWDIARVPEYPELPGVGPGMAGSIFALASTSKHKDEAFQVISYLSSKEKLLSMERAGALTVVNSPESKQVFGKDAAWLQEKKVNLAAMFPEKPAKSYQITRYDGLVQKALNNQFNLMVQGKVPDVNTALRNAADDADKAIAEQLAAKK
ncbi:ABC transporter substrate-binding protein [Paenibacillus sp. HJGM_3]|uniref:ABC transporter substrate-binding protein n=1 Tax=Paenibacillus sp. HJGM_3 TaxID=3379816 RepID=UPI00385E0738